MFNIVTNQVEPAFKPYAVTFDVSSQAIHDELLKFFSFNVSVPEHAESRGADRRTVGAFMTHMHDALSEAKEKM
jgi:hypothetical protein